MSRFEQDYAIVEYDKRSNVVVGRLLEFTEGELFREYMEALIEATKDTGSNKMLADTSQFDDAIGQEDQVWSVKDWAPRAEDAGVEYMALVMPESVIASMSVDSIVEMTDDSIERSLFDDIDEAKNWLSRQ